MTQAQTGTDHRGLLREMIILLLGIMATVSTFGGFWTIALLFLAVHDPQHLLDFHPELIPGTLATMGFITVALIVSIKMLCHRWKTEKV